MKKHLPQVGDMIPTWFSGREDGLSKVLEVFPYQGAYPHLFSHILVLTAPRTERGTVAMTW